MALNKVLEYCHALMSYPTLTDGPNLDLVYWIRDELDSYNIKSHLIYDQERKKANLFASVGPQEKEGILLSGHTDVVATEGQSWTTPPFQPTQRDNKIYARGAADMKGFIACALHSLVSASKLPLQRPLHLSLSYDEEIGCVGVHDLLVHLSERPVKPLLCIIGEPTSMQLASGHKGKITFEVMCKGRPGHSANPADALNAIHLASDFIQALRGQQDLLNKSTPQDTAYDVPHATIHVGTIAGGTAVNIVPESCKMVVDRKS